MTKRKADDASSTHSIREGSADITFDGPASAFYNPAQEFNRDLTVCVLQQLSDEFQERLCNRKDKEALNGKGKSDEEAVPKKQARTTGLHVCDALSASGLRAIRFAKEVPNVERIVANDFSDQAVEAIKRNIAANDVAHIVEPSHADASEMLFMHRKYGRQFDAVDVDPFGSPAHFLDSAVQGTADDGILMVTCTDLATMCGNSPEACLARYGTMSMRIRACHEMALRIVLQTVDTLAARYGRYIVPLLSLSIDFYLRVFLRIKSGAAAAKNNALCRAMVAQCKQCESFICQPLVEQKQEERKNLKFVDASVHEHMSACEHCGGKMTIAGPVWSGRLYDNEFVCALIKRAQREDCALQTQKRIVGMLTVVSEELPDAFLHHDLAQMCQTLKCQMLKQIQFFSALLHLGYKCSISHTSPKSVKTDAPRAVLWQILRCWRDAQPQKAPDLPADSPGAAILRHAPTIEANFTEHVQAEAKSKHDNLLRFQCNKGKNMGPKPRVKGSVISEKAGMYEQKESDA